MRFSLLATTAALATAACTGTTGHADSSNVVTATGSPASTTAATTTAAAPDPAAVRHVIDSVNAMEMAAWKTGDSAAATSVANTYAPDAVSNPPGMKAIHGHDDIHKAIADDMNATKYTNVAYHTDDVTVAGDYAIESGTYDQAGSAKKAGSKPFHSVGKYIAVWKKQSDGSWKVMRDIWNSDTSGM